MCIVAISSFGYLGVYNTWECYFSKVWKGNTDILAKDYSTMFMENTISFYEKLILKHLGNVLSWTPFIPAIFLCIEERHLGVSVTLLSFYSYSRLVTFFQRFFKNTLFNGKLPLSRIIFTVRILMIFKEYWFYKA